MKRYALIASDGPQIPAYMPGNYEVIKVANGKTLIGGEDSHGWTLDDYVLPRLASGLYFGEEIDDIEAAAFEIGIDLSKVGKPNISGVPKS